jgi:hypothetical protein
MNKPRVRTYLIRFAFQALFDITVISPLPTLKS